MPAGIIVTIIVVVVFLILVGVASTYNALVRLRNQVDEAFATMDVYLKKRYDLIPNLVETVKGYAAHEKETLESVIAARNMAQGAGTMEEKLAGENMLAGSLKSLFAVAEGYPDLKANQNFRDLQEQLEGTENRIQVTRQSYNNKARAYNTMIRRFPNNILSNMFGFDIITYFHADVEAVKAPQVNF